MYVTIMESGEQLEAPTLTLTYISVGKDMESFLNWEERYST